MDRRGFLRGSALACAAVASSAAVASGSGVEGEPVSFRRVSIEPEDAGYRAWCLVNGDRRKVKVYLDGAEVTHCITADIDEGFVKRIVLTEKGNIAVDPIAQEVLTEVAYGHVDIRLA